MAYDEVLADRIRDVVAGTPDVSEKKMFGGLAFLVGGTMAVAASGQGGLMLRCSPEESDALVARGAERVVMRGREMANWLRVVEAVDLDEDTFGDWVETGLAFARSQPPK
ncbi:TfoX/Sxy family protein [Nocardioides jiangxiensis]|uniref:TfoX/Sxy family protein n=1 Tax=Nocardioides jiangxiensis TaxID=3064524 RepID=A0ABT9B6Z6_9ACTN|nr:TfoX/Sxy family protein [Nocardioides sp. WY-20]MDO7868908.1 TfoX/Sxy family protein [Nocardioides sp. WY-20]